VSDSRLDAAARRELNGLMLRLADGDRAAFQPVFQALYPRLRAWCAHLLGDADDAEDTAQQALMKMFSQAADFDPAGDVLSWGLTLATWEARSHNRRSKRRAGICLPHPDHPRSPEEAAIERDSKALLERLVGELSEGDQEVLSVARGDGAPPLSAALRKRRERALIRLKQLWRRQYGDT
jgi:DNA-directed RNA polymerase specialized sigma24 family protein